MGSVPRVNIKKVMKDRMKTEDWSHPYKVATPRSSSINTSWATKKRTPEITFNQKRGSCSAFNATPPIVKQRVKENKA